MGYLIGQMWMLLALSAVVGVLVGWWVWGRENGTDVSKTAKLEAELSEARRQVEVLQHANGELQKGAKPNTVEADKLKVRIAELEGHLAAARSGAKPVAKAAPDNVVSIASAKPAAAAEVKPAIKVVEKPKAAEVKPVAKPVAKAAAGPAKPAPAAKSAGPSKPGTKTVAVTKPAVGGTQPKGLKGPRGGKADELRAITGVGPKLEKQLHDIGFYHFDQLAALSKAEVEWVENYIGFPGRMAREGWLKQCKDLAAGKVTAGAKAFKEGKQS